MLPILTSLLACRSGLSDASVRHAPTDVDDPGEADPGAPPEVEPDVPDHAVTGSGTTVLSDDEESTTDTGAGTSAGGSGIWACYPGSDGSWLTCLETVELVPPPADYDYPEPLDSRYAEPIRFLDLAAIDPGTMLAPNFALDEVASEWKGQWAVVQPHAIDTLQRIRDALGPTVINSGYRSPAYNDSVGGATWSRHMYGDAFDAAATGASLDDLADACADEGAGYVGWYEAHIHCDWRDDALDPVFYGLRAAGPNTVGEARTAVVAWDGALLTAPADGWDEGEPLREWLATDAAGNVIAAATGRSFAPPAGASRVTVTVGREVVVDWTP
jgi:hypothetical protein